MPDIIPIDLYAHNETGLIAPASYWMLERAEIERRYNGMGPRGLGWAIPHTMYLLNVNEAAYIHDHEYSEALSDRERWLADVVFFLNILTIIESQSQSRILRALRRHRALKYYSAVADFGKWFATTKG